MMLAIHPFIQDVYAHTRVGGRHPHPPPPAAPGASPSPKPPAPPLDAAGHSLSQDEIPRWTRPPPGGEAVGAGDDTASDTDGDCESGVVTLDSLDVGVAQDLGVGVRGDCEE